MTPAAITPYDRLLLNTIEQLLLSFMKHYDTTSFEELEATIISKAKKDSENLSMKEQMEFVALIKEIFEAYQFAAKKHAEQTRASGEPYIMHPLHVALNEIYHQKQEQGKYVESPIIAALLHDTVEDTDTTFSDINRQFGNRVEQLVTHLTNHPEWKDWKGEGKLASDEKAALQFVNASRDQGSLSIKYDDRFHNLETIRFKPPQKQVETLLSTIAAGFIEHAEHLKQFTFLIQLYIAIQQFLTEPNLDLYAPDPTESKRQVAEARTTIKDILARHHDDLFPAHHHET